MQPDVTIVTPTFRRPVELAEAIDSALAQEGPTLEMLVLDDSADGSARSVVAARRDPRLVYLSRREPSGGRPALVRNEAVEHARGRYLHFLDDDDRLERGALSALVTALDRQPRVGMAFGAVVPFGADEGALRQQQAYFRRATAIARTLRGRMHLVATLLFRATPLVCSACMVRREAFARVAGFDPEVTVCEDVEFYLRVVRATGHAFVDRPVLRYRTGAPSLMQAVKPGEARLLDAYRRMHAKYRAQHGVGELLAMRALALGTALAYA